jgi:hypothetical protein
MNGGKEEKETTREIQEKKMWISYIEVKSLTVRKGRIFNYFIQTIDVKIYWRVVQRNLRRENIIVLRHKRKLQRKINEINKGRFSKKKSSMLVKVSLGIFVFTP